MKEISEQAFEAMQRLQQHIVAEAKKDAKAAYSAVSLQKLSWDVLTKPELNSGPSAA